MRPIRQLRSTLRERAAELVDALQNWPWLATVVTLRRRFRDDRLGQTAGSLTFTSLISLVPLLTVMLAAFSAFPMFASFQDALQTFLLQSLVPETISKPMLRWLTDFAGNANRLGAVGIVFLVISALALMLTIDRALNAIWRVRTPRPIAQRVLVYWAAVTLGPLVLGISLTVTSYAISESQGLVRVLPGGVASLLLVLEVLLLATGLAALFHYVPNTHVRWRHAIAGGMFSAVGFELAKVALGWYIAKVTTYRVLYGAAFAAVPLFLIWMYLGWVVVLLGAVIAAYAPSLQSGVRQWSDTTPGWRFQFALALLRALARARADGIRGLALAELARELGSDPLQTEPILETLLAFDWIGRLDEPTDPRFVLLADPAGTPAQPLLSQFLLEPSPASRGLWQRAGFDTLTLAELLEA